MKKILNSLKFKTILPLTILTIVFAGFIGIQARFMFKVQTDMEEMNNKYFATINLVDELNLITIKLQQSLVEASVTRDKSIKNQAASYSDKFYDTAYELIYLSPELTSEITQIESSFDENYWAGRKMVDAYIDSGLEAGNSEMVVFNETSETIKSKIEELKSSANENIVRIMEEMNQIVFLTEISIGVVILAFILILITSFIYIKNKIINPIYKVLDKLKIIAGNSGDLTEKINYSSKDEIGELAKNFDLMQESFRTIIFSIKNESSTVKNKVGEATEIVSELSTMVEEINQSTASLSESMSENLASTQEMSSITEEMEEDINDISSKAEDGSENAKIIEERTRVLKDNVLNSRNDATKINILTHKKLKQAIEQTKDVEEIDSLSEIILKMSSQISLLSLNASIEAARAGEAGRGFSVVAGEIDKLADSTKETVSKIKNVSDKVIEAVNNLVDTSKEIIDFIDERVISDYEMIVETGEKYSMDAETFSNMTQSFYETSKKVKSSMATFAVSVDEINSVSFKSTEETTQIAGNTEVMVSDYEKIISAVGAANTSTEKLIKTLEGFIV